MCRRTYAAVTKVGLAINRQVILSTVDSEKGGRMAGLPFDNDSPIRNIPITHRSYPGYNRCFQYFLSESAANLSRQMHSLHCIQPNCCADPRIGCNRSLIQKDWPVR